MDGLQLTPYIKQSIQSISKLSVQNHLDRGKLMLSEIERATSKIFILSDEKMFTVEAVTNKQIDRAFACSSRDLLVNVRGQFRCQTPV